VKARFAIPALLLQLPLAAFADVGIPALAIEANADGGETWSVSLQILMIMTALTLLPSLVLAAITVRSSSAGTSRSSSSRGPTTPAVQLAT